MRHYCGFILSLSLLVQALSAYAGQTLPAIDHHELKLELQPEQHRLIGDDEIHCAATGGTLLEFRLASGITVQAVEIDGKPVPFQRDGSSLQVNRSDRTDQPLKVTIRYAARFDDTPPAAPSLHEDPGNGVVATLLPRGTFLSSELAWYPRRDGNHEISVEVSAPSGYYAVTDGRRTLFHTDAAETRSGWSIDAPVAALALAAGPFEVHELTAGSTPVYAYFYPAAASLANDYLNAAADYLALYEKLFGSYPYSKFAIVENFYQTGYGFASWTLLGSSVIRLPFIIKTSLGHEIAHSWWGNGVRVDPREGNWAEGLTTYVADYLYRERASAAEAKQYRLKILRDFSTLRDRSEFPLASFRTRYDKQSQAIGYGKCAMLFHMIRKRIGEEAFWGALRTLARERMWQNLTWSDLVAQFTRSSGVAVDAFIVPWLTRTGGAELSLSATRIEATDSGWTVRGVLHQQPLPYPLQVPVTLTSAVGETRYTIPAGRLNNSFALPCADRPTSLAVDPDADLFRVLDPREIPPSINHLRASEQLVVVALPGHEAELPALETLLAGLRKSGAVIMTLAQFRSAPPRNSDLLFLGVPEAADLPPIASADAQIGAADAGHAAITVLRRRESLRRIVAVYQPGEQRFAELVAGKIAHYGKYGQLEFAEGKLLSKRILDTGVNPLAVTFEQPEGH